MLTLLHIAFELFQCGLLLVSTSLSLAASLTFLFYNVMDTIHDKEGSKKQHKKGGKRQQKKRKAKFHEKSEVKFCEEPEEPEMKPRDELEESEVLEEPEMKPRDELEESEVLEEPEEPEAKAREEEPEPEGADDFFAGTIVHNDKRRVFCCELEGYGDVDPCGIVDMLTGMGLMCLPFRLSASQDTVEKRENHKKWMDRDHPIAQVVAYSIVAPMVRCILSSCNYKPGSEFSVAVIGDSTTAYCFDKAYGGMESTKQELSRLVTEALKNELIFAGFFSVTSSSFSGWGNFLWQMKNVIAQENTQKFKYDAMLIIGGWNSSDDETKPASRVAIRDGLNEWILA